MFRTGYSGNTGPANFAVEVSRFNSAVAESLCRDLFGIGRPHLERNNAVGSAAVHHGFMAGALVLPEFLSGWVSFGKYPPPSQVVRFKLWKVASYWSMGRSSDIGRSDFRVSLVFISRSAGDVQRIFSGPARTVQGIVDDLLPASADCPDDQLCLGRTLVFASLSVGCDAGYACPAGERVSA